MARTPPVRANSQWSHNATMNSQTSLVNSPRLTTGCHTSKDMTRFYDNLTQNSARIVGFTRALPRHRFASASPTAFEFFPPPKYLWFHLSLRAEEAFGSRSYCRQLPTAIHGFGNWSEPQDGPFSAQEDHSRTPGYVPRLCSAVLDGQMVVLAAESGWGI